MLDSKFTKYLALGTSISTGLVGPVIIGIVAGGILDRKFAASPWFSLAGVLLGLAMGVLSTVQIIRYIERSTKRE